MPRAIEHEPEALTALFAELDAARGTDQRYDWWVDRLKEELAERSALEARGRRLVEATALALQAALLLRRGPAAMAEAFCTSRLAGGHGHAFGTLPSGVELAAMIERARPAQ